LGSCALVTFPLTRPFRLRIHQWNAARDDGASFGTGNFPRLILSYVFVFVFVIVAPAIEESRAGDQSSCTEQTVVQQFLRQAENTKESYEERRKAYESAARVCPQEVSIYSALSALMLEHQDADAALTWARRGLQIAPEDANLAIYEGVALVLVGRPDQALAILKKAPPTGKNEFYLGLAYRALRAHKEAQQALLKAFTLGYNDPYVLYVLIEQDRLLREKEAGMRDFQTFSERFPGSPWLHMLYGDAYMSQNDDRNAEAEYEQVVKLAPNLPTVQFQLGFIDFNRASYAAAEEHFRKEIATNPAFALPHLYLGATLRRLARNTEALPFLKQAVQGDPNNPLAYNELATAQVEAGKPEEALRTLREGEVRFPQEAAFPAQLAGLLKRLGRPEEAKSEAEKATRLSNSSKPPPPGIAVGPEVRQ